MSVVAALQQLSPLEAAGVLFSVLYLVLAIRESLWCWPCAFVSSVLTIVVMAGARLYAEAALNVFYAAMAVYGYVQWRYGGRSEGRPSPREGYEKGYYSAYLRDPDGYRIELKPR